MGAKEQYDTLLSSLMTQAAKGEEKIGNTLLKVPQWPRLQGGAEEVPQ